MTQRVTARATAIFCLVFGVWAHAALASAQPQPPPPPPGAADRIAMVTTYLRATATGAVLVRDVWQPRGRDGRRACEVTLQRYDSRMAPVGRPVSVYRGQPVRAGVAVKGDSVLIAMVNGSATPFVKVAFVPERGAPRTVSVTRPTGGAGNGFSPSSVVAADDPEGFTVLWQEEPASAGGRGAASYMVRVGPDGALRGEARGVGVPWALGALAWNGHGFHLAAFYDGSERGQTRICLVTLTREGTPEQHPWWAAPPDDPSDVQMLQSAAGMVVLYRGGEGGSHVYSFVSTAIGQWGREAERPRELGTVDAAQPVGLRVDAQGAAQIVAIPARAPRG